MKKQVTREVTDKSPLCLPNRSIIDRAGMKLPPRVR